MATNASGREYKCIVGKQDVSALAIGGEIPPGRTGQTEEWNGASWAEVADLSTARDGLGGNGTTAA